MRHTLKFYKTFGAVDLEIKTTTCAASAHIGPINRFN